MLAEVEPLTHMLTGGCLSRALGYPRRTRHATLACVLAAEFPDVDFVYRLGGPLIYFQHHRGWTHALWSLPLQAAAVVGLVVLYERLSVAWRKRRSRSELLPMRPGMLWLVAMAALLSHLLLDWSNNYGVRPFAPFNPRWYAADLDFVVEPVLLVVLSLALIVPLILSLADSEMGIRRVRLRGQGLAIAAFVVISAYWGWRWQQRSAALEIVRQQQFAGGDMLRASLGPYPVNPYRWHVVVETPLNYATGDVDPRLGVPDMDQLPAPKPETTLATLAAKHSWLGRVYLDWSAYPIVREVGAASEVHPEMDLSPHERQLTVVRFRDLRFGYDVWGFHGRTSRALEGEVWVNDQRQIERTYFGGVLQK